MDCLPTRALTHAVFFALILHHLAITSASLCKCVPAGGSKVARGVCDALSSPSCPDRLTDGGALQIRGGRPDRTHARLETLVFADMSGIAGRRRTPCWTRLTAKTTHFCYQRQQIRAAGLFWGGAGLDSRVRVSLRCSNHLASASCFCQQVDVLCPETPSPAGHPTEASQLTSMAATLTEKKRSRLLPDSVGIHHEEDR